MRILFVTAGYLPDGIGGVELHLKGLATTLGRDHEVLIFRRGADPARPELDLDEYHHDGVRVLRLNYLFSDAHELQSLVDNPAIRARFETVVEEFAPDIVHVHHLTCLSTSIVDACVDRHIPVVLSLHDFWLGCPRGQRLTSLLSSCDMVEEERCTRCYRDTWPQFFVEGKSPDAYVRYHERIRTVLDLASALVVPSPFAARLYEKYGIAKERLRIVPYGVDAGPFSAARARSKARGSGARVFGFIGTILPSKGVHVLIDAFARLVSGWTGREGQDDLRLSVHGASFPYHNDPGYADRMDRMARPLGDRVRFHGRYENEDLPGILSTLDVLVVPSIWFETWGIVVREARLAGVPVIVSDFGALADAVEDERDGLRFEKGRADVLVRQMGRLAEDPSLGARLAAAPVHVDSISDNANAILKIYEEVLSDGREGDAVSRGARNESRK